MGVDIYGKNPKVMSAKPELANWEDASSEERDLYLENLHLWNDSNPGVYFRSNWWGWRPIVALVDAIIERNSIPINTNYWGSNDGQGLENQEQCDMLADAIEEYINIDDMLVEGSDTIYLCLGAWCTLDGRFITDLEDELNEQYPLGTVMYQPIVLSDGSFAQPAHSTSLNRIKEFVNFLRNCGGFEIW